MKLMKRSDLPLYFCGICSDSNVLAIINVIPNPIPPRIKVSKKVIKLLDCIIEILPKTCKT